MNKMSDSPNSRLKAFIESINDSYEDIAEKTGYSRRTWQRQVEEGASIKSDYLLKLRDIYDADVAYILTGESANPGSQPSVRTYAHSKSVQTSEHQVNESGDEWDPEEFVSVPFYPQVYASGGQGLITDNESSLPITFRRYFFSNTIMASPNECFMIRIKGDSMHPLYPDGSDLLVDQGRTKIKEGPGFLVRIEDSLYCKLLRKIPGKGIEMRSKNEDYQPVEVSAQEKDFEIIGEVVWHAAKSKYI